MKHSALGVSIFVAGMMAANAANAQFSVVGQPPQLLKAPGGTSVFAPSFNGPTVASDFGTWFSFPQPSALTLSGGTLASSGGPFGPSVELSALVLGKHVFSPQSFTVEFDVDLLSENMAVGFDLFGAAGPREKFTIQAARPVFPGDFGAIEFKVRDDAGENNIAFARAQAIAPFVNPVHATITYDHLAGDILFSVRDFAGQTLAIPPVAWTIQQPFRINLQAEKSPPNITVAPSAKWRNLVTNLRIPDHLLGSVSPLRNNVTGITYNNLPLGIPGVTYVDPSTPVFGANFVAGAAGSAENVVAMPSVPANYSAMVIETSPGTLFTSTGFQTIFTTSTIPGDSVLPLGDPVKVMAFFPNCFLAPNTPPGNPTSEYLWRGECLTTATTPGVDLAVSGWMAIPRPGFARRTYVYVNSLGDQTNSGVNDTLTIRTPPEFINPVITTIPDGASCSPTPPVFVCQLPPIGTNLNLSFVIDYTVLLGAILDSTVDVQAVLSVTNDANTDNNTFHISDTVQGAVDPNDKLAIPEAGPIVAGELLHYVVRFENVGNLATDRIIIVDTLDPNIDRASVAFISHRGVYNAATHEIAWDLRTPLGPHEQGFVEFRARARADLRPGDTITNRASIQFDFNAPIVTAPIAHFIPVVGLPQPQDTVDCLKDLLAHGGLSHNHKARHEVVKAIKDVQRAIRKHAHGDLEEALERIDDAVKHLQKATKHGADLSSCQPLARLWAWALDQVDRRIAAAAAAAGEKNKNVKKAREERADAVAAQARGNWHKAFEELIDASRYASKALPQPRHKGDGKRDDRD